MSMTLVMNGLGATCAKCNFVQELEMFTEDRCSHAIEIALQQPIVE